MSPTCMKSGSDSSSARLHRVSLEGTSAAGSDRPASLKALDGEGEVWVEKGRCVEDEKVGCEGVLRMRRCMKRCIKRYVNKVC